MAIPIDLNSCLDPQFVEDLPNLAMDEIRSRRSSCSEVELSVSYMRRLVQGYLDIVLSELEARKSSIRGDLVDKLPSILGQTLRVGPSGRPPGNLEPKDIDELTTKIEMTIGVERLSKLNELSSNDITEIVENLVALEEELSASRLLLHKRIDIFQQEIIRRYKSGEEKADSLLK